MGGAKNCPETPRQRMIGMMYLVLTAMLALNVSAAILNGYLQVDESLHATIQTTESGNRAEYDRFANALSQNKEKTQEWYDKAMRVKDESDKLFDYITDFKNAIVKLADGSKAKENATVREIKGNGSSAASVAMAFKLCCQAEKNWRRLRGFKQLELVARNIIFVDGELKNAA